MIQADFRGPSGSPTSFDADAGPHRRRRRARPHLHDGVRLQRLKSCLNEMDGFSPGSSPPAGKGPLGEESERLLADRVSQFGRPPRELYSDDGEASGRSAWREILSSTLDYAGVASTLQPLDISRLDLPGVGTRSVPTFGPDAASRALAVEGFQEKFCLPLSEARALQAGSELKRAYVDPLMRHNCTQYGQFVSSLCSRGVLELCAAPGLTEVGFFAVAKKNGRQRLVVDARTANQHFRDPPGTQLPMGTTFTSLCAERSEGMFFGGLDLKDYFYHLELPVPFGVFPVS